MRSIVIDLEQAEKGAAVPKRRRAQRVEALLDDRRAHAGAARVIAIADREERRVGLDGCGRQRSGRQVAAAVEVADRQPPADLRDDLAIAALEEDGRPVAFEQDHRMIDQAGQDPVEVEPTADVAGDSPEHFGAVPQVADLGAALSGADERTEAIGAGAGGRHVVRPKRPGALAHDQQDAPRPVRARDRDRQLRSPVGSDREHGRVIQVGQEHTLIASVAALPECPDAEGGSQDPESARKISEAWLAGVTADSDGHRRQAIATRFPDRNEAVTVGIANGACGRPERLTHLPGLARQPGKGRRHPEIQMVSFGRERVGPSDVARPDDGRQILGAARRRDRAAGCSAMPPSSARCRRGLGRCEESLQVPESIPPIPARVDPEVAQPSRVAPGSDRVGVHAQQPGGLGHRQGGVRGAEGMAGRHRPWRKCELDRSSVASSQFLPIARWSRSRQSPRGAVNRT